MTQDDYFDFVTLWTQAFDLYGKSPSDGALDLTFAALQRYEVDDIRRALTAHVNDTRHGDFVPKPADIVRHIDGDGDARALTAWSQVEDAIRRVGNYQTVIFDDPRTMAAIEEMGGWIKLCQVTDKELPFTGNAFKKRYQSYLSRPPERFPAKLVGVQEASNAGEHDAFVPEPRLIGDPQKCLAVREQGQEKRPGPMRLSDALATAQKAIGGGS